MFVWLAMYEAHFQCLFNSSLELSRSHIPAIDTHRPSCCLMQLQILWTVLWHNWKCLFANAFFSSYIKCFDYINRTCWVNIWYHLLRMIQSPKYFIRKWRGITIDILLRCLKETKRKVSITLLLRSHIRANIISNAVLTGWCHKISYIT